LNHERGVEWKIIVGPRGFNSGYLTVKEEDRSNYGRRYTFLAFGNG
jgi:hypothetical protein